MTADSPPPMLTLRQTVGLLQRFMPGRDAAIWLERDRLHQPLLSFLRHGNEIRYFEEDVIQLVRKLAANPALRRGTPRRQRRERRHSASERRTQRDRRHSRRCPPPDLDRRFAVRPDRRSDLDRRIRGWVDRRCIPDRRTVV